MFWAWKIFSSKKSIEVINVGDEINRNKEREIMNMFSQYLSLSFIKNLYDIRQVIIFTIQRLNEIFVLY